MPRSAPWLRSVRTRLALWHTGVLALVLLAFTAATFAFLERLTQRRVARSLEEAVTAFEHAVIAERRNGRSPEVAAQTAAREFRFSERRVLVYGRRHRLLAISDSTRDVLTQAISAVEEADDSPLHPLFASLVPGASAHTTLAEGGEQIPAYAASIAMGDESLTIVALQVGLSERAILSTFLQAAAVAIPLALMLAGAGGYHLARRSFAPVIDMGRQASSIDSVHLRSRLPVRNTGDEMDELASIFNAMLERLESAFDQQRQFVADASHELRTPIASLRASVGIALSQGRTTEEYAQTLTNVSHESRRLSTIVDNLFTLALLDTEVYELRRQRCYLEEVVMQGVRTIRPLAQERNITLDFTPLEEACVLGDAALLDRVITNLLDNAVKYSQAGGTVEVQLERGRAQHVMRVIDHGAGIPAEAQARIFDRFFRADAARTRSRTRPSGAGLGLSIAWRIVHAHGGTLTLARSDGRGTVMECALPAA